MTLRAVLSLLVLVAVVASAGGVGQIDLFGVSPVMAEV